MILQPEHLSKLYGGRTLFHDVTFRGRVRPGWRSMALTRGQDDTAQHYLRQRTIRTRAACLFAKGVLADYL